MTSSTRNSPTPAVRLGEGSDQHGWIRGIEPPPWRSAALVRRRLPGATDGAVLVDVRTPVEYELWHIPGAVNIPLATIRDAVAAGDLDPARPVQVYCAVGFRSYLAYRILVQKGFGDVAALSGGSTTFKAVHEKPDDTYEAQAPSSRTPKRHPSELRRPQRKER